MTAEKALKSYKSWITRKNVLEIQLKNITTTLEKDMIDSMNFFQPYEEFIKTSSISDKTPKIALNYKHMALKGSMDSYKYLRSEYINLCNETSFLEFCISKLNGYLPSLIWDMVVENKTWEQVMSKYHISHSMVAKYRKKAIRELNVFYAERDEIEMSYILS